MNIKFVSLCVGLLTCISVFAIAREACTFPDKEMVAIRSFFSEFKDAVNSKDIERVKKMSGDSWPHWLKVINNGKLKSIDILDVVAETQTNVVTMCIAIDSKNKSYPADVVFTMWKSDGAYAIKAIRFPEHERRHREFVNARTTIEQLVLAINNRDLCAVKGLVSFGDAADFDVELSARGLAWIQNAIEADVDVSEIGSGVSREGNDMITGRLHVPCTLGGSNIVRKVAFKGDKIDRAAQLKEITDVFCEQADDEKSEVQRRSEKHMQEEYDRILRQQLLRRIK